MMLELHLAEPLLDGHSGLSIQDYSNKISRTILSEHHATDLADCRPNEDDDMLVGCLRELDIIYNHFIGLRMISEL